MRSFQAWVEAVETMKNGAREIILNFLRDELQIRDDQTLLNMNTNDMDSDVVSKLLHRGIISTADPEIMQRIKNGVTVQELIDLVAQDTEHPTPLPTAQNNPGPT